MCRSFESNLEPSLRRVTGPHANLRVAARVYDVEGGAIFAKNSTFVFFDGFVWTPRLRSPSPIMAPGHSKYSKREMIVITKVERSKETSYNSQWPRVFVLRSYGSVLEPVRNGSKTGPAFLQVQFSRTVPCKQKNYPIRFSDRIHLEPVPCKQKRDPVRFGSERFRSGPV